MLTQCASSVSMHALTLGIPNHCALIPAQPIPRVQHAMYPHTPLSSLNLLANPIKSIAKTNHNHNVGDTFTCHLTHSLLANAFKVMYCTKGN